MFCGSVGEASTSSSDGICLGDGGGDGELEMLSNFDFDFDFLDALTSGGGLPETDLKVLPAGFG